MIYPEGSVILAPLSGFSDLPYRLSARRFGCRYAFTEMVDAGALVFGNQKTLRFLARDPGEDWLGIQLIGVDLSHLQQAVEIVNQHEFSVLDFNLGCPAPKVVRKGEGAALGKKPEKAIPSFEVLVKHSRFPVSAKIRILDEHDPEPTIDLVRKLAEAGAAAVTIHGRLQKAYYSGPVFCEIIAAVNDEVDIQIIANGGVKDYDSYMTLKKRTGCDCVMLATGAMGNPWLFTELSGAEEYFPPTVEDLANEIERHVLHMIDYYDETLAMKVSRKVILDYLGGRGFPGKLKSQVSHLNCKDDFLAFMQQVRRGPSHRYWSWLKGQDKPERRLEPPKR